jgi:hypothetical protein
MIFSVFGSRFQRWAPLTGVLFVVLIVAGFFGPGAPKAQASAAAIVESFAHHRSGWLLKLYIESVGWALFLWFLGSVAAALRRAGETQLAAVASAAGTAAVALTAMGYVVQLALAFDAASSASASTSKAIYDLSFMAFVWSAFPFAVLLASTAAASLRTRVLPTWYAWATAAGAALTLLGGAALSLSGFFAPDESGGITNLRYMILLLWALVTAILLLRRGGDAEPSPVR